jgi:hypothetical protein
MYSKTVIKKRADCGNSIVRRFRTPLRFPCVAKQKESLGRPVIADVTLRQYLQILLVVKQRRHVCGMSRVTMTHAFCGNDTDRHMKRSAAEQLTERIKLLYPIQEANSNKLSTDDKFHSAGTLLNTGGQQQQVEHAR